MNIFSVKLGCSVFIQTVLGAYWDMLMRSPQSHLCTPHSSIMLTHISRAKIHIIEKISKWKQRLQGRFPC